MRVSTESLVKHAWKFRPGEVVVHRNRGWYRVVACAFTEATLEAVYVYQCMSTYVTWTRPQSEFEDGRFVHAPYAPEI